MSTPLGTTFSPAVGVMDTSLEQSRSFCSKPHIDAYFQRSGLQVNSTNLVLTRNSVGNWSYNRTAAGTESYFVRTTLSELLRVGEAFQFGDFGGPGVGQSVTPYPPKGLGVIDIFAVLNVGVVALTAATLRLGKTVYSATVAPVQTDIVAATALGSLAVSNPASQLVQVVAVPVGTQQFTTDDLALLEVELALTMASTGTVQVAGLGAHVAYNLT